VFPSPSVSTLTDYDIAYEFLKETVLATECYQKAGMWQECLYIAASRPLDSSGEDIQSLSQSFVENLLEIKDYPNAARVYLEHLNDVEEAVRVLCKGSYFADAMRTVCICILGVPVINSHSVLQ
jgi:elongator complex protein 1